MDKAAKAGQRGGTEIRGRGRSRQIEADSSTILSAFWRACDENGRETDDRQTAKNKPGEKLAVEGWKTGKKGHWDVWIHIYVASVPPGPWPDLGMTEHAC